MKIIFWKFLGKWLVSDFGHKTFGRMVKLPLRVQWNSDGKFYFLGKMKIFLSFPHIMWNNFATSNEIARVVNLAFIISSRTFWKNVVWMKQFTGFQQILTEQKTLGRVLTSPSYASRGTLCRRTVFWNDLLFQLGWMTSGAVENHNLRVQKNIFGDVLFKNQFFVLILGFWAKIL